MPDIILIGNYPSDRQQSMLRFAEMLADGFTNMGFSAVIWHPKSFLGALAKSTDQGLGKWLGYIDKWLIYPVILKSRLRVGKCSNARFHICDHANAAYLNYLPKDRTSITCHDVLAIRGAQGFKDTYCPPSWTGKFFQKWILSNLRKARLLAAVSQNTLKQLIEVIGEVKGRDKWTVIYNSFNAEFEPVDKEVALSALAKIDIRLQGSYILHVGSGHPRKNRKLLLQMMGELGDLWTGVVCFAGEVADGELLEYADSLGVRDRVISVSGPDHFTLLALYSKCTAFIFPSFSEGFGWPVIEAQACGAPVIASDIPPMPEISGSAAIHVSPHDAGSFAKSFIELMHGGVREKIIAAGFENCLRFDKVHITKQYLALMELTTGVLKV